MQDFVKPYATAELSQKCRCGRTFHRKMSLEDVKEIRRRVVIMPNDWSPLRKARYLQKDMKLEVAIGTIRQVIVGDTFVGVI